MKKLIIFSDLDGTLLDHNTYDWKPASPALESLKENKFPLILNSSKTCSEIELLRNDLKNIDPYICENGSVVHTNQELKSITKSNTDSVHFNKPYSYIKEVLNKIKHTHNFNMLGFNDMDLKVLMKLTGLSENSAIAARKREATEPLLWNDSDESLHTFTDLLSHYGLILTKGGRFYHVSSPANKGASIKWLINQYQKLQPETQLVTVGLGDSFNDISMLELVDYPILIKNTHIKKPDMSHIKNLIESKLSGPDGWNVAVLNIIKTIKGTK